MKLHVTPNNGALVIIGARKVPHTAPTGVRWSVDEYAINGIFDVHQAVSKDLLPTSFLVLARCHVRRRFKVLHFNFWPGDDIVSSLHLQQMIHDFLSK